MEDYLSFTESDILERVDEYSLYCHYLGYHLELGSKYLVPTGLRASNNMLADIDESFSVFQKATRLDTPTMLLWKDHGGRGYSGDIFELVKRIYGYSSRYEVIQRIASEFGFGAPWAHEPVPLIHLERKQKLVKIDIAVKSKPWTTRELLFWDRGHIDKKLLMSYDTSVVDIYWTYIGQKKAFKPTGMMFAYWVMDKYQLYSPYAKKEDKFINDWTPIVVPGFTQLQHNSDLCIITKSLKDVMCLRSFGYESISVRSENVLLPKECIGYLKRKYKKILILFDNDGKHRGDEYEFEKIYVPKIVDTDKDSFDYCDNHGDKETRSMLKSIIYGH